MSDQDQAQPASNQSGPGPATSAEGQGLSIQQYLNKIVSTTADMLGILEIEQSGMEKYRQQNGDLAAMELQAKIMLMQATLIDMQESAQKALQAMQPKPTILKAGNILGRDGLPLNLRVTRP